jgi:polyhydroxyalkanoate synthase
MILPFNVPDEFLQGMFRSGHTAWRALAGTGAGPMVGSEEIDVHIGDRRFTTGPLAWLRAHSAYWQHLSALCASTLSTAAGAGPQQPVVEPKHDDRRFSADEWSTNAWYSVVKQTYLLNARLLEDLIESAALDEKEKHRLRFFSGQFIDSMSPANFAATNPEAMRLALESSGESLRAGLNNLIGDLQRGTISITDQTAFEVGRNVAVSEGAVVFENDLFQLIQYAPLTDKVALRPLVIVPPCINKFYILDLQPANSFVRFACEQGMTVFIVSWRNPGAEMRHTTWDDYLEHGVMKALELARVICGTDKVNALGWCVGGTLLASALAVLRARGDETVASMTLLTTMLDFRDPGDLGVFIDEQGVSLREQSLGRGGLLRGQELGFAFQTLRPNDLIWPYVVGNYLKGQAPAAFDLLYWNADATNLPGPMYAWYLRNMYLENNLHIPNRLTMCGTPVDLGRIDMPAYVLATQEDHIVPWQSAYRTTQLVSGETQFVLGASGHIAGVVNPASKNRRSYWVGNSSPDDAELWLASAESQAGSWWVHWMAWLEPHAGEQVNARRKLGNGRHKPIEPAPGRYVKVRND